MESFSLPLYVVRLIEGKIKHARVGSLNWGDGFFVGVGCDVICGPWLHGNVTQLVKMLSKKQKNFILYL